MAVAYGYGSRREPRPSEYQTQFQWKAAAVDRHGMHNHRKLSRHGDALMPADVSAPTRPPWLVPSHSSADLDADAFLPIDDVPKYRLMQRWYRGWRQDADNDRAPSFAMADLDRYAAGPQPICCPHEADPALLAEYPRAACPCADCHAASARRQHCDVTGGNASAAGRHQSSLFESPIPHQHSRLRDFAQTPFAPPAMTPPAASASAHHVAAVDSSLQALRSSIHQQTLAHRVDYESDCMGTPGATRSAMKGNAHDSRKKSPLGTASTTPRSIHRTLHFRSDSSASSSASSTAIHRSRSTHDDPYASLRGALRHVHP